MPKHAPQLLAPSTPWNILRIMAILFGTQCPFSEKTSAEPWQHYILHGGGFFFSSLKDSVYYCLACLTFCMGGRPLLLYVISSIAHAPVLQGHFKKCAPFPHFFQHICQPMSVVTILDMSLRSRTAKNMGNHDGSDSDSSDSDGDN